MPTNRLEPNERARRIRYAQANDLVAVTYPWNLVPPVGATIVGQFTADKTYQLQDVRWQCRSLRPGAAAGVIVGFTDNPVAFGTPSMGVAAVLDLFIDETHGFENYSPGGYLLAIGKTITIYTFSSIAQRLVGSVTLHLAETFEQGGAA